MLSKRRIFIGDIHGDIRELDRTLVNLGLEPWRDELVFLGDYIDRGKDSFKVLDRLRALIESDIKTTLLWGNHEQMLYEWSTFQNIIYGETSEGRDTINQLAGHLKGYRQNQYIFKEYEWLWDNLKYHAEYDEHVAVHGGLDFSKEDPLSQTNKYGKVNIRGYTYNNTLNKPLIVGHTPQPEILVSEDGLYVNIDTGCGIGGQLSSLIYYKDYGIYTDGSGNEILLG